MNESLKIFLLNFFRRPFVIPSEIHSEIPKKKKKKYREDSFLSSEKELSAIPRKLWEILQLFPQELLQKFLQQFNKVDFHGFPVKLCFGLS